MTAAETIDEKISMARALFDRKGALLASDNTVRALVAQYDSALTDTFSCMKELELGALCFRCATSSQGGGCCGRGIDEWYDHYLIIMNLMLGVTLPEKRHDPSGCFFLGPSGCTIRARYHFCVNYLCHRIHENRGRDELSRLAAVSGRELYISWLLEMRLRELGV